MRIIRGNSSLEEYALPMDAISNSRMKGARQLVGSAVAHASAAYVEGYGWLNNPVEFDFTGTTPYTDTAKRVVALEQHSRNAIGHFSYSAAIYWTTAAVCCISDPYLFVHNVFVSSTAMRVHIGWGTTLFTTSLTSSDPGTDQLYFDFDTGLSDTTIHVTQKANSGSQVRDDTGIAITIANYWEIDYVDGKARMRLADANGAILFDKTYTTNLPAENIVLIPTVGLMPLETVSKIQRFYCADLYANVYKVAS